VYPNRCTVPNPNFLQPNFTDAQKQRKFFQEQKKIHKTKSPLGFGTEHLFGGLIGVGGTSRVYKLGKLDKVAIKV
jgi:hypothetical protein